MFPRTVTFNNGTEFAHHHALYRIKTLLLRCPRPLAERRYRKATGRMRRLLPPRKCLDWQTPAEAFFKALRMLELDYEQVYDCGAAVDLKLPKWDRGKRCRNFNSAARARWCQPGTKRPWE